MPIRINLKEIFPSDPQEINVEKLNFNFNKLLELGIGTPGSIGLTGPQGPAGPIGSTGPQGIRGATWWVDSNAPTTHVFTGLIDGDLYLDNVNFEVWSWDAGTSTWTSEVSISAIVQNYLNANGSPFVKTLGNSLTTQDDRFIAFGVRNSTSDFLRGVGKNVSANNLLYLNNFNETSTSIDFPTDPSELYNSLLNIVTDHSDNQSSSAVTQGRYHIELGSLYNDGTSLAPLSKLHQNLKIKFYKRFISTPELPLTNTEWINTAKFSLSTPDGILLTDPIKGISQNGEFEFVVPKWNNEGTPVKEEIYIRLGSAESFAEQPVTASVLADGISITNNQVGRSMAIGLRDDLGTVLNLPYSTSNFALFDVSDDVDGLFFNKTLIQTGGNFEQIITTGPTQVDQDNYTAAGISTSHFMGQSISANGTTLWISSAPNASTSYSSKAYIVKYDISNPDNPLLIGSWLGDKNGFFSIPSFFSTDQHGHMIADGTNPLGLIKDIAEYGKYIVTLHHRSTGINGESTDLVIRETDSYVNGILNVGRLSDSRINDAYRVQVNGRIAWVITNRTYQSGPFPLSDGAPVLPVATLSAVDISTPNAPIIVASYSDDIGTFSAPKPGRGTKYLDLDIKHNKAFVLKYRNYEDDVFFTGEDQHQIEVLVFDITDPNIFNSLSYYNDFSGDVIKYSPQESLVLSTFTTGTTGIENGALDVNGNRVYTVHGSKLYISEITTSLVLTSTTILSVDPVLATDILVRGNYAYILVNYSSDSTGAVQVWDISDKTNPLFISETRNTSIYNAGRIAISGKNLYITSVTGQTVRLTTLDSTGIESPSAMIGSLKTNSLHVTENAVIQNNLHVKTGMNVGPGGIFIDRGEGLSADGPIISNISTQNGIIKGGLAVNLEYPVQGATTPSNFISLNTLIKNPDVYDVIYGTVSSLQRDNSNISFLRYGYIGNLISRSGPANNKYYYGGSLGAGASAFVGSRISLGDTAAISDKMYSNFYGSDIILGTGVDMQSNNAYGYKFSFNGTSSGTVYGLHIEGADENYVEGSIQLNSSSKIKNEWHGWIEFAYDTSSGPSITSYTLHNLNLEGFAWSNYNWPTTGVTSPEGSITLSTPGFTDSNKVVIQLTPRYEGGPTVSRYFNFTGQVNSGAPNNINIYMNPVTGLSTTNGNIEFNISIYEYK